MTRSGASRATLKFWGQPFSRCHYPPINQQAGKNNIRQRISNRKADILWWRSSSDLVSRDQSYQMRARRKWSVGYNDWYPDMWVLCVLQTNYGFSSMCSVQLGQTLPVFQLMYERQTGFDTFNQHSTEKIIFFRRSQLWSKRSYYYKKAPSIERCK